MNCPVCNTTELSDDTSTCPQCQSDLEVFRLIVDASEQRQKNRKIISALSVFAAVTAIGWASVGIFSGKSSDESVPAELSPVTSAQNEVRSPEDAELITILTTENSLLKSENAALTTKLNVTTSAPAAAAPASKPAAKAAAKPAPASEGGTTIHTVRNGDTFWIIAKKYYGDGTKYKQIAKDNGLSVKSKLRKGQKLKIQS